MSTKFEFVPIYEVCNADGDFEGHSLREEVAEGYTTRVLKDTDEPRCALELAAFRTEDEAIAFGLGATTSGGEVIDHVETFSDKLAVCLLECGDGLPDLRRVDYRRTEDIL